MDRQIPRGLDSRLIQVDSAYRRADESVNKYNIYFDSHEKRRSKIVKDVVGLRINKAIIPKVHDNIIAGLNIVNLHVITPTHPIDKIIASEADLVQYLSDLSANLLLKTENGSYKISSTSNQLLISSSSFPNSTSFDNEHCMLVSSEPKIWNITFPITLSLSVAESHRILLKPGYYPTSSMLIGELFEAFANVTSVINENLQYYHDWNKATTSDDTNGWSVYKEARGMWTLYFRTLNNNDDMKIFFSREPGTHDVLNQLGLRSTQMNNWAASTHAHRKDTNLFKMKIKKINPTPSSTSTNTIIGKSTLNFSTLFSLEFEQINLTPRRYVDVIIRNLPNSSLITNSTSHNEVFARIDLATHTRTQTNLHEDFDESSSSDTYAFFENNTTHKSPLFDPISLDHLEIELVDNMGHAYTAGREHTLEIELTVIGDATSPFDFPINDIGSVKPQRRKLVELPEFPERHRRRSHKKKKIEIIEVENPSPITNWIIENKVEVGAATFTFFTVLYLANKIGVLIPPDVSTS